MNCVVLLRHSADTCTIESYGTTEWFFFNQMRVNNDVSAPKNTDFRIDDYIFEVGGAKKGQKQLEGNPNGIIVRDDIEFGHSNIIPLWHFGLNY